MQKTTAAAASNEVAKLLKEAADRGHLVILRAASMHDDARASLLMALSQLFQLTAAQSRALMALLEHKQVSREAMHAAMAHDGNPTSQIKTIDVILCKMRSKLATHDIEVVTVWGQGFRLAENARDKINRLLAEHGAGIIAPAEPAAAPPD